MNQELQDKLSDTTTEALLESKENILSLIRDGKSQLHHSILLNRINLELIKRGEIKLDD